MSNRLNQFLNPEFAKQVEDAMIRKNAELVPHLAYSSNSDHIADAMAKALNDDLEKLAAFENSEACQESKDLVTVTNTLISVADHLDALGLTRVGTCVDSALHKLAGCECGNKTCMCSGFSPDGSKFCGCEGNCKCKSCTSGQEVCGECLHKGQECRGRGCDCTCGNCAMKGRCASIKLAAPGQSPYMYKPALAGMIKDTTAMLGKYNNMYKQLTMRDDDMVDADDGLSTDAAEMLNVIRAALIDTSDKLDSMNLKNVSNDIDQALAVMACECSCC